VGFTLDDRAAECDFRKMSTQTCPIVGIPTCSILVDDKPMYRVAGKYAASVVNGAGCLPLLIPAVGEVGCFIELMSRLDGLFLTGGASNVRPDFYDGGESRAGTLHDPERDATTLPLIRAAVEAGVPVFAVCRGIQELNVALGGTLHQNVHELPGKSEHRMNRSVPQDERYEVRHPITINPGGMLEKMAADALAEGREVMVNSLHAQAIDRLGEGLFVEAVSDDGVIEAVSVAGAKAFALGVQWHPEHPTSLRWPLSQAMFGGFGNACRERMAARQGGGGASSIRAA
jgi:putative glutamine amidotransferase